jgi:hypothetical protein
MELRIELKCGESMAIKIKAGEEILGLKEEQLLCPFACLFAVPPLVSSFEEEQCQKTFFHYFFPFYYYHILLKKWC